MKDKKFLWWIHQRLVHVHGEKENFDYMQKLRSIIAATPSTIETPIFKDDSNVDILRNECETFNYD